MSPPTKDYTYEVLRRRVDGLLAQKGSTASLIVGYETTVLMTDVDTLSLYYRGEQFATLTPDRVTVWHNKEPISTTLARQISILLRPFGKAVYVRDGATYLSDKGTHNLMPFPSEIQHTITAHEESK